MLFCFIVCLVCLAYFIVLCCIGLCLRVGVDVVTWLVVGFYFGFACLICVGYLYLFTGLFCLTDCFVIV